MKLLVITDGNYIVERQFSLWNDEKMGSMPLMRHISDGSFQWMLGIFSLYFFPISWNIEVLSNIRALGPVLRLRSPVSMKLKAIDALNGIRSKIYQLIDIDGLFLFGISSLHSIDCHHFSINICCNKRQLEFFFRNRHLIGICMFSVQHPFFLTSNVCGYQDKTFFFSPFLFQRSQHALINDHLKRVSLSNSCFWWLLCNVRFFMARDSLFLQCVCLCCFFVFR